MFKEVCKKARWQAYAVVRILVGLLFFLFGAMKFGWLGGSEPVQLASMFGVAGVIEIIVGLALVLGFLVRRITVLGSVEMLVALVYVHFDISVHLVRIMHYYNSRTIEKLRNLVSCN